MTFYDVILCPAVCSLKHPVRHPPAMLKWISKPTMCPLLCFNRPSRKYVICNIIELY